MSASFAVLIPGSSVPAARPGCGDACPAGGYARRLEVKHYRDQQASLDVRVHLDDALRLLSDPASLDRGALRDAVLAAKRSLL